MKISKSLLSAIVVGIAVQTAPSCTKTSLSTSQQTKTEPKGRPVVPQLHPTPAPCLGCGMG